MVGTGTLTDGVQGWYKAYKVCNNDTAYGGDPTQWTSGQNVAIGVLPSKRALGAVSGSGGFGNDAYDNQAALHAGWGSDWFWTGEANLASGARDVYLVSGTVSGGAVSSTGGRFVCPR